MQRPDITTIASGSELRKWYWLKSELVNYCRDLSLPYQGAKFDLLARLADAVDGAPLKQRSPVSPERSRTKKNWSSTLLTMETLITNDYTNGPNSRRFFIRHCGESFRITIPFMQWIKQNTGKPLSAAVQEYHRQASARRQGNFKSVIPAHNQYNQYVRDFFADNPNMSVAEARACWLWKRSMPEPPIYRHEDPSQYTLAKK